MLKLPLLTKAVELLAERKWAAEGEALEDEACAFARLRQELVKREIPCPISEVLSLDSLQPTRPWQVDMGQFVAARLGVFLRERAFDAASRSSESSPFTSPAKINSVFV